MIMHTTLKASAAMAALVLALPSGDAAQAADLGGSIKDRYVPAPAVAMMGGAGPCYFRGDVGYSVSRDPTVTWPVNNGVWTDNGSGDGVVTEDELSYEYVGDTVSNVSLENTWLAEGGVGCGSGSRGFRTELMFGYRGDRKLDGEPLVYNPGPSVGDPDGTIPEDYDDPMHTSIQTYTMMLNVYHDLGNFNRVVPYLGAGVGVAYHTVDDVYFTGNPNLVNRISGDSDLSFAWSLMAGVGYQISERAILDFGYRYIDMGKASSGRNDTAGFVNPAVKIDDIEAHEFKIGLRYHFGQSDCCGGYEAMK
jgi:opacity protein-like surface antigen